MRNAFADQIKTLAGEDPRVVLLSGDIGNRMFDGYKELYPDRFYNCGVAEANMTGVAAGMALCGLRPVTYTITAFNTLRCLEQIRLDICYQNLPVTLVGVGGGLSYASLNSSHHALEDIAALRSLPNMTVLCPADAWEVRAALIAAHELAGPAYIRMGKKNEPLIHESMPDFEIGKAMPLRDGTDVCLIATGHVMPNVLTAADLLQEQGISASVVNMHTVKPIDEDALARSFEQFKLVLSIEEHGRIGGLGGAIAEWRAEQSGALGRLVRLGTGDHYMYTAGEQDDARAFFKLSPQDIAERTAQEFRK